MKTLKKILSENNMELLVNDFTSELKRWAEQIYKLGHFDGDRIEAEPVEECWEKRRKELIDE